QFLGERDNVLFDRVDVGLHRFGDVHHEHDVDGAALSDSAKIKNLGLLAVLEDFDVVGSQVTDRVTVGIGQSEVELHSAVRVEVLQSGVADRDLQTRPCAGGS